MSLKLTECSQPRTVLIEGKRGIGKTTFCDKIAYNQATKKHEKKTSSVPFRSSKQFCHLNVEIQGQIVKGNFCLLLSKKRRNSLILLFGMPLMTSFCREVSPKKRRRTSSNLFTIISQEFYWTLTDGLSRPQICNQHLKNLFKKKKNASKMSVGSYSKTRAWDLGVRVLRYGTGNKRVYPRRRPRFYCQVLQNKPELASKLLNQLDLDGNLKQLTHSPLYTVLLCLLCEDIDGIFAQCDTQLYLEIVECVLRIYRKNKR